MLTLPASMLQERVLRIRFRQNSCFFCGPQALVLSIFFILILHIIKSLTRPASSCFSLLVCVPEIAHILASSLHGRTRSRLYLPQCDCHVTRRKRNVCVNNGSIFALELFYNGAKLFLKVAF